MCFKARGREDQRKAKDLDEQAVVKVSMDYCSGCEISLLVGRETNSKHANGQPGNLGISKKAKALWTMRDAKTNGEAYYDRSSERQI